MHGLKFLPAAVISTVVLCLLAGCKGPLTLVVGVQPGDQTLASTTVQEAETSTKHKIALIDVSGVLMNSPRNGLLRKGENPVSLLHEQLEKAASDEDVKAVVLRINSPGGGVTASDAMHRSVLRFKEKTGKPVIALCMDVAASGGYYLACAADEIVAYPSTVTGSIGVILQTVQLEPALNRWGIRTDAIVSGPNKAAGSPLSTMTGDQRQTLQSLVDDFYADFKTIVKEARPQIPTDHHAVVFDGRVFSGKQARELGLVDELGGIQTAITSALDRADIPNANVVLYHRPLTYVATPYSPAATPGTPGNANGPQAQSQFNLINLNVGNALPMNPSPGFYYLWTGQ